MAGTIRSFSESGELCSLWRFFAYLLAILEELVHLLLHIFGHIWINFPGRENGKGP
jgi:hypothetical protein